MLNGRLAFRPGLRRDGSIPGRVLGQGLPGRAFAAADPNRAGGQNADTPVSARPMSSLCIWLVPSYSVITRASRSSLPAGYSSM